MGDRSDKRNAFFNDNASKTAAGQCPCKGQNMLCWMADGKNREIAIRVQPEASYVAYLDVPKCSDTGVTINVITRKDGKRQLNPIKDLNEAPAVFGLQSVSEDNISIDYVKYTDLKSAFVAKDTVKLQELMGLMNKKNAERICEINEAIKAIRNIDDLIKGEPNPFRSCSIS